MNQAICSAGPVDTCEQAKLEIKERANTLDLGKLEEEGACFGGAHLANSSILVVTPLGRASQPAGLCQAPRGSEHPERETCLSPWSI